MRAAVCRAYGPPEDLVVEDVADPVPGPGQVVVRVHAAAVNFPDVLMIEGKYQVKAPPPFTPGSELAGEVIAVGEGTALRPGQRVSATTFVGAFAEQALLHSANAPTNVVAETRWPGRNDAPSPTASTSPASSLPGVNGGGALTWYLPSSISTSG